MRAVNGAHPGMIPEAFSKRDRAQTEVVQQHSGEWLGELQESLVNVERVRANGPDQA